MQWLLSSFEEDSVREALVWRNQIVTYADLLGRIRHWSDRLEQLGVRPGDSEG
jgi:hypothetical protein